MHMGMGIESVIFVLARAVNANGSLQVGLALMDTVFLGEETNALFSTGVW